MSSPFEEVVDLRVRYHEAQVRKAAHDIETLQKKADGIPLTMQVRQESFRRAAAQLDALTKLRTTTVKVDVDERPMLASINSLRSKLQNTRFTAQLDKTGFETKFNDLELKRAALAQKFTDGFRTKLDADAALVSLRKLNHETDTLHSKLDKFRNERFAVQGDSGGVDSLGEGMKRAAINASSLRAVVSSTPPATLAASAGFVVLAGSVSATAAAGSLAVVTLGGLAAASLASTTRMKEAFGNAAAEIRYKFTEMSSVLLPTFERIATGARQAFSDIAPTLQSSLSKTGPLMETLFNGAVAAVRRLSPHIDNLIQKSGPLVEGISNGLVTLAGSVGNVLDRMADSSRGAGDGIELLADGTGHVITQLGELVAVANTVAGAVGAVKDTFGLLTKSIPGAAEGLDTFANSALLALNPLTLLLETASTVDEVMTRLAPKLVTVEIQGKAKADPTVKPSDLYKNKPQVVGLGNAVEREASQAKAAIDAAIEYARRATVGGRFKIAMEQSDTQQAFSHMQGLRKSWTDAMAAAGDAERRVSQVSIQNAQAITEASRGIARAETAVRDAQANTRRAQEDLNQARRDAALDIQNMKSALRDLGDNEEAALIRLERAKLAAEEAALAKGQEFTQEQLNNRASREADLRRRETLLEVKNAEEGLSDVRAAGQATRAEIAEAERRGIENHPLVLGAKQQLTSAVNTEKSAQDALIEANWKLEEVQRENTARMAEVSAALAESRAKTDEQHAAYQALLGILGLTDAQVVQYTQHLKELPGEINQFIKLHGLDEVLTGAARLGVEIEAQRMIAENPGLSAEEAVNIAGNRWLHGQTVTATRAAKAQADSIAAISKVLGRKDGGPISGPGDSRSDSIPIMAARGEFMQPTDAVQHYGTGFMESIRKKQFPKFADGGSIGYDWNFDARKYQLFEKLRNTGIVDRARANAQAHFAPTGDLGGGNGLGSSAEHSYGQLLQVARKFDKGAILTSGLRPGDPGNHGKGLAADFAGNMGAIARGFFGIKESLLQLIHSGSGGFFAANGKAVDGNGYYGARTVSEHFDHVHVAARKDAMEAILNGGSSSVPGGSGVERWRGVVNQALGIMGQPVSLANTTLRRMNQESGGQHDVVNKWDSNWHAGTPSVGLMQVIGPTYKSNRHPQYDVGPYQYGTSTNPLANLLASMRYALGRYGSLPAAYDRPGGYKDGGFVADDGAMLAPGLNILNNQTGKPEPLLNGAKDLNLSTATIAQLTRMLAQVLSNRPAALILPDGRVLAETVSDAILGEATVPGVSF